MKAWYVTRKSPIETYPQKPFCKAPGPAKLRHRKVQKIVYNLHKSQPIEPKFLLQVGSKGTSLVLLKNKLPPSP